MLLLYAIQLHVCWGCPRLVTLIRCLRDVTCTVLVLPLTDPPDTWVC